MNKSNLFMIFNKKVFRYYYWFGVEFFKKHLMVIIISFIVSFIGIISVISIFPYFHSQIISKKEIIGLVGKYDFNNIPAEIEEKLSNGLIYIDQEGKITPTLASSWEMGKEGKTYRFHLKNNLLWNDEKRLTAYDINYHFKDVSFKAIDETTVDFYLKKPLPIFPTYLKKPIFRHPLIGIAGLYKTVKIKQAYGNLTEIVLSPNKRDLPTVIYKFYDNETRLLTAYKRGEINEMKITKKAIADGFSHWKNTVITKSIDYSKLMTLFFNVENQHLKQKEIKEAIDISINPQIYANLGEKAFGPIPPISWAYNPNLKRSIYDPQIAEKIINKSMTATSSAKLNLVTYYDYYSIASEIKDSLEKIGLSVNLNIISYDKPDNFDFLLALWNAPSDPDQYYFWHSTQKTGNIGGYKNVKIDKLLEDGRGTIDLAERKKIYFEFQKVIIDDTPAVFLYYPYVYTIKRK